MSEEGARILVADDEASIRFVLREALEDAGHRVTDVVDGDRALEALGSGTYDLAFLDIRMPGQTGLELLDRLRAMRSETAAVIITAQNTFDNAVEAMKRGALDYLVKPFAIAEVTALAEKALRTRALQREVRALRREVAGAGGGTGDQMVGTSAAMLEIFKTVGRVAAQNVTVLVTGESGTGKELVARAIHQASPRADGPFIAVNAAAIPRELLESELFGHEKGAFTGAVESRLGRFREASGGTLFLDEIGDMPTDLQAKLLRVLQNSEVTSVGGRQAVAVDVRIIAATHRDLDTEVRAGRFREDLIYRLRVVPLPIPPLRERTADIRTFAEHFTARYAREFESRARYLAPETITRLEDYDWPGNVRELENAIKRALVLATAEVLTPDDFAFLEGRAPEAGAGSGDAGLAAMVREEALAALEDEDAADLHRSILERVERPLLETVLERTRGNQIQAAALLGINRNTLRKKIAELGIPVPGREPSGR
ncbi:MAG: sigma-54 dependent transcriptional regulator [Proteobacteria bacterium]|nr:sigma-54 dependent transcriptional regulator [Pseudomonadota bacterium]